MTFDAGTWWLVTIIVTVVVGLIGYLFGRSVFKALDENRADIKEVRESYTTQKDHKDDLDDLEVLVNGRSARQFCSQGQVRTAALALKLADREIHRNTMGEYPIMLLDDVLSELDPRRQEYVLNRIAGGQVFITCCENDRLDTLLSGKVFHIRGGEVLT